ncbi:MAG TPA: GspH/FimT family pseudopilin [Methylophilaceae bacterium]|nr:GspH/FimT family pseudopilin [Methylophilaceae bacterium]
MSWYDKQSGFSLVELVIVIAIFGILASFAVPSYQQMIENSKIKTATDSILSGFQIARAEAVKRNINVQLEFGAGSAWTVCVSPAGGGSCTAANTIQSRKSSEGSSSDVTVVASVAGPYVFNGFGILTSPGGATIDIDNAALSSAKSRNLRVIAGASGAIKSCDPSLDPSGSDPRRC